MAKEINPPVVPTKVQKVAVEIDSVADQVAKVAYLDINNPKHANLTYKELQQL